MLKTVTIYRMWAVTNSQAAERLGLQIQWDDSHSTCRLTGTLLQQECDTRLFHHFIYNRNDSPWLSHILRSNTQWPGHQSCKHSLLKNISMIWTEFTSSGLIHLRQQWQLFLLFRRAGSLTGSTGSLTVLSVMHATPQICINIHPDAVPPIHVVSYHVATDKPPAQNGNKFRSIFSNNLQPIATCGKKAHGTLLVDQHCGNGCSIKRTPLH